MIIYRQQRRQVRTTDLTVGLARRRASPRDLLIGFGELECGVADALPWDHLAIAELRRISLKLGQAFYRSCRGAPVSPPDLTIRVDLPPCLDLGTPEGYAYYGLFPETYVEAAERFFHEDHPRECVVIGIRSIGTSLSAAVAGAIAELGGSVESFTIRPGGHPFHRTVEFHGPLKPEAFYLLVDEGPGLSGSSFGSLAEALTSDGIPDSQIILFPSWRPDPASLISPVARDHFPRHRSFVCPFDPQIAGLASWRDLSAGKWRSLITSGELPAAHPQHERRKFLHPDGGVLAKFAGFGARGEAALARAQALHAAGFVPRPLDLSNGFLFSSFAPGRPVSRATPALALRIADYLNHVQRIAPSAAPGPWDDLAEMITVNLSEALDLDASPLLEMRPLVEDAPATLLDGRMLPHEWIETASGFLKTDAVDHYDDHFFPGPQNIAWDVAAAMVEFSLDGSFLDSFDRATRRRVPFYAIAYGAFRLAYCRMAEASAPEEGAAFRRLARRYEAVTSASPLVRHPV